MKRLLTALMSFAALTGGCDSDKKEPNTKVDAAASHAPASAKPSRVARCEGLGPDADWRDSAVSVGNFGLLAPDVQSFLARRNRNGDYVTKMGAVVEGRTPITVRVPQAERTRVRLAYAGTDEGTPLREAPVEVKFIPCERRDPSGYVGGLLLDTVAEPVTLEVATPDSEAQTLTVPAGSP